MDFVLLDSLFEATVFTHVYVYFELLCGTSHLGSGDRKRDPWLCSNSGPTYALSWSFSHAFFFLMY